MSNLLKSQYSKISFSVTFRDKILLYTFVLKTVLAWTLIQSCFNLIHVITDQVLSFVGGQISSKLGQDTEDKANNMFLLAARTGPGMVGSFKKGDDKSQWRNFKATRK